MDGAPESVSERIVRRCEALGFAMAGVCDARASAFVDELRAWIGAGKHGSMEYLAEHAAVREDPSRVLEGARSAVMVADLYATRDNNVDGPLEPGQGRIARYARGRDYHDVLKKRLIRLADELRAEFPDAGFRVFTDTAPVMERELAARAGLGWTGKHTLLIHPKVGSYFLLGGILTTLELEPPAWQEAVTDHCGTCTRCIEACPTGAITAYSVDARKCVSYLTIERREPVDPGLYEGFREWVYGCDICQEVCPHNSARDVAPLGKGENPAYVSERDRFDLLEVLGWDEDARRAAFSGSAMKRAKLDMMRRNAVIVAGNWSKRAEVPALRVRLKAIALGEDGMVGEAARVVLESIGKAH
ncbi:MAG: tRNA epoxyqueuosine(34) reductase QueG [Planctomycetes bacterium]|nr:tRNA epoxyqueuosine(34) reductase QueG [Planctomycetota bacterium]